MKGRLDYMCKVFPGARCANHTWSDFTKANKRKKEIIRAIELQANETGNSREEAIASPLNNTTNFNTLVEKLKETERDAREAMLDYESTPAGQKRLQEILQAAQEQGQSEQADAVQKRLEAAKERRKVQVHATHLQTNANRVPTTMNEHDQITYVNIVEVTDNRNQLLQGYIAENKTPVKMHRLREQRANDARKRLATTRSNVEKEQKELAKEAYQSYLDAGLDSSLAEHYTQDYITSFRTGWDYFNEDSTFRTPQYGMGEFKTKGQDHEQENPTHVARLQFMQKPRVQRLAKSLYAKNESYYHAAKNAQRAEKRLTETNKQFQKVTERFTTLQSDYESSRRDKQEFIALRASGLESTKTYAVTLNGFRQSAHVNPDGGTNAYALVQYGEKNNPYYAQVKGTVVRENQQVVLLENGQTVTPEVFASMNIRLVAPQEGAQRMFQ